MFDMFGSFPFLSFNIINAWKKTGLSLSLTISHLSSRKPPSTWRACRWHLGHTERSKLCAPMAIFVGSCSSGATKRWAFESFFWYGALEAWWNTFWIPLNIKNHVAMNDETHGFGIPFWTPRTCWFGLLLAAKLLQEVQGTWLCGPNEGYLWHQPNG